MVTDDGYYYRHFFIKNGKNKITLDLDKLSLKQGSNKYSLVEETTLNLDNIKVEVSNKIIAEKAMFPYPPMTVLKTVTVTTETQQFGEVIMVFDIYVNPQVRNGVSIFTSKRPLKKNSSGFVVCYQKNKEIKVPRLTYCKPMKKSVINKKQKIVVEHFDYLSDGKAMKSELRIIEA